MKSRILLLLSALFMFASTGHAAPDVTVIVDGQRMSCGKGGGNGGGRGGKVSYGCKCYKSGSYTYLKYMKFNRENGSETNIRDITYWYGSDSQEKCNDEMAANMLCNNNMRRQLETIYGCKCYESGSYTYLKYYKYDRDSGSESNIRDITYWYGSDSKKKCRQEKRGHALCNNGGQRRNK